MIRRSSRLATAVSSALRAVPPKVAHGASAPTGMIDTMTVEEFHRFNEALSAEDKELQANLLMWCITRSIPYTLDLFYRYKRTVQDVRDMGLF